MLNLKSPFAKVKVVLADWLVIHTYLFAEWQIGYFTENFWLDMMHFTDFCFPWINMIESLVTFEPKAPK